MTGNYLQRRRVPPFAGAVGMTLALRRGESLNRRGFVAADVDASFKSLWRVVEGYLSRWRIEETIRFIKQEYGVENIRLHSCNAIRNMASLVLASAYFATVWIGRQLKRAVLAEHLERLNKRLNEVPQFRAYATAPGIRRAFSAFGRLVKNRNSYC